MGADDVSKAANMGADDATVDINEIMKDDGEFRVQAQKEVEALSKAPSDVLAAEGRALRSVAAPDADATSQTSALLKDLPTKTLGEQRARGVNKRFLDVAEERGWCRCEKSQDQAKVCEWLPEWEVKAGTAVGAVVEKLDAAHLKATAILEKLEAGQGSACWGLMTLVNNL